MSAIRQYNRRKSIQPIAFILAGSGAEVSEFVPGECICKRCRSSKLEYNTYLEDAKCSVCAQWQQEEVTPL